jgi:hypothetical protein
LFALYIYYSIDCHHCQPIFSKEMPPLARAH